METVRGVELVDGSIKLDFISGIGVHGAGHSHPAMVDAGIDAAIDDTIMQGNLQQHRPSLSLCQALLRLANQQGAELDHCLLSTSGAMANENALKIAFHNRQPADRIIAFTNCFSGRTLSLAALTDRPKYREGLPPTMNVDYLPFFDPANPKDSTSKAVERLEELLNRYPGRHAAFWAEPIAGEGGYMPGDSRFFETLIDSIRAKGILTIFDEVQTFGRTTHPYAFQHFGLDRFADIVTVGKITQVCATLYRKSLKPSAPILSQTFTGSSSSIAAGLAMLEQFEESGCFGSEGANTRNHHYFASKLEELGRKHAGKVSGPFGEGMMIAFTPGDGTLESAKGLVKDLFDAGLMCFLCGGDPYRVRFLPPPVAVTTDHIDSAIEIIDKVLAG